MMANIFDSESDEELFEGFPSCNVNQPVKKRKKKLVNKALESTEEDDDDDSDDFKGSVKSSGRKRKALEAFESDEDDSGSDEDDTSSSNDDDDDDTGDGGDDNNEEEEDGIETEDTLDVDLNEDADDIPSNSDQCPVCLMSLGGQKLGTPSECQHVFCLACIMEWSKNANTCPVDRKVFHEILVHSTKKGPILERIPVEDRRVPEIRWEQEPTFCEVCNECNREDRMLLCDGCDKGYHLECLRPRLYTVPAGSWYCTTCIEIRRNEQMEEEADVVPELLPGNVRRSRGTARASTRSERSSETSEPDGAQRARTAATSRRRSSSTRGRGRGRGRTGSRSSTRGRSRSRTTGRSRTGSSTGRGRGGKKKTRKRTSRTSTTSKSKRKKPKTTSTKKKRRSTTKSKAKKRKVDDEESYRNPFEAQSFRGRTPRERLNNSLRASGGSSDTGRGLGMSSGLSIFGDHYALNEFEDGDTNELEQFDSPSSVSSANPDVLGSIFNGIEALHDQNATVSRDGRVLPSESPDKHSPNKRSPIKANESSSTSIPGSFSRESSEVISPRRDKKQRESEKHGNRSCDGATSISRDQNHSHMTSMKTNESHLSNDKSRDIASVMSFSGDQTTSQKLSTEYKAETSLNSPSVKDEKETSKRHESYQTGLQSAALGSNKLHEKASAFAEKIEGATPENTRTNSSETFNIHKKSTGQNIEHGPSSKIPFPIPAHSSFPSSSSKRSPKQPTSSSETHVRFKIPKKSSHSPDSSFSRETSSPGKLPSKSYSPQDSKVSHSADIPESSESKTPTSVDKVSSQCKSVSPIPWTDRDIEHIELSEFKVKAHLPKTSSSIPPNNELNSPEDKKICLSNDSKNDFTSSSDRNFDERHRSSLKLDETKSDFKSIKDDHFNGSAFSSVAKIKVEKSAKSFDVKQEKSNIITTTDVAAEPPLLGNQCPSFYSKPSLQQLPTLRSSSPLAKVQGLRPLTSGLTSSTSTGSSGEAEKRRSLSPLSKLFVPRSSGMTSSASTSLSRKTEKQSSTGQDARVIEYSREKGQLKIKVVPNQEESHRALRGLPEKTHFAVRSLPEEFHSTLRSLTSSSPIIEPPLLPLNTVQPISSLKPLKPVARHPARPKLRMLSTSETSQPASGTTSNAQPLREFPNRTNQNLAIIQMLRHKTSSLRSEVEKGHSLLREEIESSRRETSETEPDSFSRGSSSSSSTARPSLEGSLEQHEIGSNRPKLSSLFGLPRNFNLPIAVVRPSLSSAACVNQSASFAGFADSGANGPQSIESERERNRKKGIARLQRIERIKSVVKASLQAYYDYNEITKQDFKEIFVRAVNKVKDSDHEVDRHRIAHLVKKYVKMFKGLRVLGTNHNSVL